MASPTRKCPGCSLAMPESEAWYDGYYHTSPECWAVYTEVLGEQFQNAVLFGSSHQPTVDAYALQHAGGQHPDKSVVVHLVGLHLVFGAGLKPPQVAPHLQRLATGRTSWPHYEPPADTGPLTIYDVAVCAAPQEHIQRVRDWSLQVWNAWSPHHAAVAELAGTVFSAGA